MKAKDVNLSILSHLHLHCIKSVRIRSFSGTYFPAFGLNTERYEVSLCIQSKCGKTLTRKTSNMDTFHTVLAFKSTLSLPFFLMN